MKLEYTGTTLFQYFNCKILHDIYIKIALSLYHYVMYLVMLDWNDENDYKELSVEENVYLFDLECHSVVHCFHFVGGKKC